MFWILLLLLVVSRAAFVLPVTYAHNRYSDNKLTMREMGTIWWAGLMRGAVSGGCSQGGRAAAGAGRGARLPVGRRLSPAGSMHTQAAGLSGMAGRGWEAGPPTVLLNIWLVRR